MLERFVAEKRFRIHEIDISSDSTEEDQDEIAKLNEMIKKTEEKIAEVRDELQPVIREQERRAKIANLKDEERKLENELLTLEVKEHALEEDLEEQLHDIEQLRGTTLDLEIQRAELKRAQEVMDSIAERAFKLRTEQRAPDRVNLQRPAAVPQSPVPVSLPLMLYSSLAAFLSPFVVALMGLIVATALGKTGGTTR